MEVQSDILAKLICSVCSEYLSCSPVYQLEDGKSVCGRCSLSEEQPGIRILPYEQLASTYQFPCSYTKYGCTEKPLFTETKKHEADCEYKPLNCVVTIEAGKCDWTGSELQILEHTRKEHPKQVIEHPARIQHEYNKNSNRTFILIVFDLCFLLHAKVCLETKKIYHCVRLLAEEDISDKFYYDLEIFNNNGNKLIRRGKVAASGSRVIIENCSEVISINTIVECLNGIKDTMFKITIRANETSEKVKQSDGKQCVNCRKILNEFAYPNSKGEWYCANCLQIEFCKCSNEGCTFKEDTPLKLQAHRDYFCEYEIIKYCFICREILVELNNHFSSEHSRDIFSNDTTFTVPISKSFGNNKSIIITTDFGFLMCNYFCKYNKNTITFKVRSNLQRGELYLYQCELQLQNLNTLELTTKTLDIHCDFDSSDSSIDWLIIIEEDDVKKYMDNDKINFKLTLSKK